MSIGKHEEIQQNNENPKLMTCAQWSSKYGWPSQGGLRWMIFKAKNEPRLRKLFLRVNRRVLLNEAEVLRYLEEMNQKSLEMESK